MEQTKSVLAQENLDRECLDNNNLDLTTQKRAGKKAASKRRWFWAAGICALTAAALVTGTLILRKEIKINPILAEGYEVHGVDVSHYQGTIDWDVLSQDLDFAFIKATEGSTHVDDRFQDNWQAAEQTHLYLGAYHFSVLTVRGISRRLPTSTRWAVWTESLRRWSMWSIMGTRGAIRRGARR